MKYNQKKNRLLSNMYILFLLLFLTVTAVSCFGKYSQYLNLCSQQADIEKQIEQQQEKNILLKSELEMIKSDSYIEQTARERLGYVKENQVVFIDGSK